MDPFQPSPLRQSHKIEEQEAPCSLQLIGQEQEHAHPESNHQNSDSNKSPSQKVKVELIPGIPSSSNPVLLDEAARCETESDQISGEKDSELIVKLEQVIANT